MLYHNILAVLRKSMLNQLKYKKKKKKKILSLKVLKIGDSYQVPNINLSSEILDIKSLKYYLHQGFTGKKNSSRETLS